MKKMQRKKALETFSSPKQRPVAKESIPPTLDLTSVKTTYLKKGSSWRTIDTPVSLNGFQIESYISNANTLFLSKIGS
jgi:hypothetical protein